MTATTMARPRGATHITLWIGQLLLAGMFAMAGSFKTFTPIPELAAMMPWVADAPGFARFVGISELLAVIGLILPAALRVLPWLTPAASAGLAFVMACAIPFHLFYLGDPVSSIGSNVVLGGLAVAVT